MFASQIFFAHESVRHVQRVDVSLLTNLVQHVQRAGVSLLTGQNALNDVLPDMDLLHFGVDGTVQLQWQLPQNKSTYSQKPSSTNNETHISIIVAGGTHTTFKIHVATCTSQIEAVHHFFSKDAHRFVLRGL